MILPGGIQIAMGFIMIFFLGIKALYKDNNGQEHAFNSPPLWMFSIPYLRDGKVKVYHKHSNINNYFVDIDGSIDNDVRVPKEYFTQK